MPDLTGNRKKRTPLCAVTRAMADAGRAKLDTLTALDTDEIIVSDDQLVAEVFQAMWAVYWDQVHELQDKNLASRAHLILPPNSLTRQ